MTRRCTVTAKRNAWRAAAWLLGWAVLPAAALDQGTWREAAALGSPAPEAGSEFGSALALDAGRLVVGQRFATVGGNALQGSAHVYRVAADGVVVLSQSLFASDGVADDRFGASAALGGGLLAIGAQRADIDAMQWRGALYVFAPDGQELFVQSAKLTAPDGQTFDEFGTTAATDGATILGGTPQGDGAIADQGAAYHFSVDTGGLWQLSGKLTDPAGGSADQFAIALDLLGDLALIGAPRATVGGNVFQGRAQVFRFGGGVWQLEATLTAGDGQPFDAFGSAVALAGDQALIGASAVDDGGLNNRGAVYVFDLLPSGQWVERQKLLAPDGQEEDLFGDALDVAGDRAVAGAPQATGNTERSGVVYVLDRDGEGGWQFTARLAAGQGQSFSGFGRRVAIAGELLAAAAPSAADGAIGDAGLVHVFASMTLPEPAAVPAIAGPALVLLALSLLLAARFVLRRATHRS